MRRRRSEPPVAFENVAGQLSLISEQLEEATMRLRQLVVELRESHLPPEPPGHDGG